MMFKRCLSLVLVLCCLAGCLPLPAGAEEPPGLPISGTCGDNLTWTLDEGGTLTISGTGDMTDYNSSAPWATIQGSIKAIVIEEGVTSIGSSAFLGSQHLKQVALPNSIATIADGAFGYCSELTSIEIPKQVKKIGKGAFIHCGELTNVNIPDSVTSLGSAAFLGCSSLLKLNYPGTCLRLQMKHLVGVHH